MADNADFRTRLAIELAERIVQTDRVQWALARQAMRRAALEILKGCADEGHHADWPTETQTWVFDRYYNDFGAEKAIFFVTEKATLVRERLISRADLDAHVRACAARGKKCHPELIRALNGWAPE